jgi:hypothetical protein
MRRLQLRCTDRHPGLPHWRHGQVTAPSELSRSRLPALLTRPSLGSSSLGDRSATAEGATAVAAFSRRPYPDRARRARPAMGVRWNRDAAPAGPCPPAWWVGRSLATRPRAVTPGERPEYASVRGDHHPARIRARQGPPLHLLAEARGRLSVHPADLRLALPGVPHPRAVVLQPRRPAVPGARHRAAGGGAGPAVARQGNDAGRHRPASSGP